MPSPPTTTLVTGATGLVGKRLLPQLGPVAIVSRNPQRAQRGLPDNVGEVIGWDPVAEPLPWKPGRHFQKVVNLMGESIAEGRWTAAKKQRIRDSRVVGTRHLVDTLLDQDALPEVLVSASAIGIYGNGGETPLDEAGPHGQGFLIDVCESWEEEAMRLAQHGVRVVTLRIGIVLAPDGGAVAQMAPLFRWGLGGRLGSGQQWMSWIHIDDLVSMILWALEHPQLHGPVNATSPQPARNRDFTASLARATGRWAFLPAPRWGLRLALGEFADSLFLSQRVLPRAAEESGFRFRYPELDAALASVV